MRKKLTLSIVIPVYNEQRYLGACLEAIAAQSLKPDEVIVVDNNSTDDSAKIAAGFKFVKVIAEHRQHQSFAQHTGFDTANGDILGRIDADTILPPDWVTNVKDAFRDDEQLAAVTGSAWPYDLVMKGFGRGVFRFYNWLASELAGTRMLWGANCALRASVWRKVRGEVLLRSDIWEDQDLSFKLHPRGKVLVMNSLDSGSSFRAVHHPFIRQVRYQFRSIRTFYLNRGFAVSFIYAVLWFTMTPLYAAVLFDTYILKPLTGFKEPY